MNKPILQVNNLQVKVGQKRILNGLNLSVGLGEVHVLMGPNGSGKSTLAHVLARHPDYVVESGSILWTAPRDSNPATPAQPAEQDLLAWSPEACAWAGLFLSFQYPIAIPGVSNIQFLKSSVNAVRTAQSLPTYDAIEFLQLVREKMAFLEMDDDFLQRPLNEGFSGGEKKRNEILQMLLLEPKLAILDEIDSGLDIDSLQSVAKAVNAQRTGDRAMVLITHYQRLLDYVEPNWVHVMSGGQIVHSGDKTLPLKLEQEGYAWLQAADVN